VSTQIAGAKPGDGPFAAREGEEEPVVGIEEEVEAAEGAALGFVPLLRFLWVGGRLLPSLLIEILLLLRRRRSQAAMGVVRRSGGKG